MSIATRRPPKIVDVHDPKFLTELGRQFSREFWRGYLWGVAGGLMLMIALAVLHTAATSGLRP